MKIHKDILLLALTALIIIFNGADSQLFPPITPTRPPPPPPPPPTTTPPPPPTTTPPPPPPPPKTPKSTTTSTTPTTTSNTTTTTNPFFPPPTSSLPPSSPPLPSLPPTSSVPISPSIPTPSPSSSIPQTPSSPAANPPFDCSVLLSCSDPKTYCDIPAGKCRSKKKLGDQCNNDNECSQPLVCRENACGYSDVETANARNKNTNDNYNVKKVAIFGAIIVGASGICGLVFFVIRYLKKKRDYDIASRLYSTDDDMSDADPYPFAERSNSFSKNTSQPPRAPTTNRYDNLPPTGNRAFAPRPGYQNYYNKYNEGMYMRQNMPNEETRTMNLLQQTRGNVMVTPQQQNYNNWNMRMNQGGLFPIPTVNVVPSPNNMNNVVLPPQNNIKKVPSSDNLNNAVSSKNTKNMNNTRNINNINSPGEDDDSKNDHVAKTLRYSVDYTNDQNNHQTNKPKIVRRDSNTLSSDDVKEAQSNPKGSKASKERNDTYNPSILDSYARESIFAKTLETKLSQSSMKYNNNADDSKTPTIQQNISRAQLVAE